MKAIYRPFLLISIVLILTSITLLPARADDETPPADTFGQEEIVTLKRVMDLASGITSSNPSYMTAYAGSLYFSANGNDGFGLELWELGSPVPIDINPGAGGSNPAFLTVYNNALYFGADGNDGKGNELWKYTPGGGAVRVTDINTGAGSAFPAFLAVYNNILYFEAGGNDSWGSEIWQYDPINGASHTTDIVPGSGGSFPTELIVYNQELYFHANGNDGAGEELWKFNTTDGAQRVFDLNPGLGGSDVRYPAVYNGALFFQANAQDGSGAELWRYDPLNGVQQAADINLQGDSLPYSLRVYNGALYFGADGGDNAGMELWKFDPVNGARRVADVNPGPGSSTPIELTVFNNALYFSADGSDGAGRELWMYNNTATARFRPTKSYDGWVLESSEISGVGGSLNNNSVVFNLGDDAQDRQFRSILSFDTSPLPDKAVILSASLKIRLQGLVGTNPFTTHGSLLLDIMKGAFSGNNALQTSDFQAAASKANAGSIPNLHDLNNWFTGKLLKTAFPYLNKTGLTQLRLRFAKDDNDDNGNDLLKFFSADSASYTDFPLLEVKYYIP